MTRAFWNDTWIRALRTFAQTLGAVLAAAGTGLIDAPLVGSLSAAGMAALLAVLTALGSLQLASDKGEDTGSAARTILEVCAAAIVVIVLIVLWQQHVRLDIR